MEYFEEINKYYQNQGKGKFYLFIFFAFASLLAWYFIKFYRPLILETGCSQIAEKTSSTIFAKNASVENEFTFEKIKEECIRQSSR